MSIELRVPEVGESITEGQIAKWLKAEGEAVAKDEPVVEVETDKVTVEVPAPAAGVMGQLLKKPGEQARVGEVIAYINEGAAEAAAAKKATAATAANDDVIKPAAVATATTTAAPARGAASGVGGEPRVMPAAQRILAQSQVDVRDVQATGPGGRVLKEDAHRYVEQRGTGAGDKAAIADGRATAPTQPTATASDRQEQVVPITPMRKRIAQRLVEAQQTAALLTTFNEVDMSAVMALRAKYREAFEKKHGVKLGFMSFFVKASVEALKRVPQINAEFRGDQIVYRNYFDIGMAVSTDKGLVVPIVRSAERLSFAQVEKA